MGYPVIGNLNPRTHGKIANWHRQLPCFKKMGCNYLWINPEREETSLTVPHAGTGSIYAVKNYKNMSSSFSNLTSEQRDNMTREEINYFDRASLREFVADAEKHGMQTMGDLVFAIVARDNEEVIKEENFLKLLMKKESEKNPLKLTWREEDLNERDSSGVRKKIELLDTITYHDYDLKTDITYHVRFKRTRAFNCPSGNTALYIGGAPALWPDVAFINYGDPHTDDPSSSVVADYFINNFWRENIKYYLDIGFKGFRCDAAYDVPAYVWQKLIDGVSREGYKNIIWLPETLGYDIDDKISRLGNARIGDNNGPKKPAFSYAMNSASWLGDEQFLPPWFIKQQGLLRRMSQNGGVGFVDSHDHEPYAKKLISKLYPQNTGDATLVMEEAIEQLGSKGRQQLADEMIARYKKIASVSNGIIVMNGTQYCCPYQPSVFQNKSSYWNRWMEILDKYPELDITSRIAEINQEMVRRGTIRKVA